MSEEEVSYQEYLSNALDLYEEDPGAPAYCDVPEDIWRVAELYLEDDLKEIVRELYGYRADAATV